MQGLLQFVGGELGFEDLLLLYHQPHALRLVVVLNREVDPFLLLHFYKLLAI